MHLTGLVGLRTGNQSPVRVSSVSPRSAAPLASLDLRRRRLLSLVLPRGAAVEPDDSRVRQWWRRQRRRLPPRRPRFGSYRVQQRRRWRQRRRRLLLPLHHDSTPLGWAN